jgi:hypothetical protein
MKKLIFYTAIIATFFFSSCAKDNGFGEAFSYGKVQVQQYSLPDQPGMDLFCDGKKMTDWNGIPLPVQANTPSRISIYVSGTHEVIADTSLTVVRGETVFLWVGYNEVYGVKGFYFGRNVPADSFRVQFKYMVDQTIYPAPDVDLYIYRSTDTTAGGLITIVNNISYGNTYSPVVTTLPAQNAEGNNIIYVVKMKDKVSGEFIKEKSRNRDFMTCGAPGGSYIYVELTDNKAEAPVNKFRPNTVYL